MTKTQDDALAKAKRLSGIIELDRPGGGSIFVVVDLPNTVVAPTFVTLPEAVTYCEQAKKIAAVAKASRGRRLFGTPSGVAKKELRK